jgi:ADP-ribosyl-[dinitrogen reductase] hydrolase
MNRFEDKVLGTLLGVAIGDALGATLEFLPYRKAQTHSAREIVGGGFFDWRPGQPTDDTDQTLIVARAVAYSDVKYIVRDVERGLIEWLRGEPPDVGSTTRRALERKITGARKADTRSSLANGSLMRTAPLGFLPWNDDTWKLARNVSAITHTSLVCCNTCADYVCDIAYYVWPFNADEVSPGDPRDWYDGGGHVQDSYDIARWAVQEAIERHDDVEMALRNVVRLGGDADTNGAIAGGLLGARYGAAYWPERWVSKLETAGEIFDLAAVIASRWG